MKLEFLFQVWPYIAVALFGGVFVARYALSYREGSPFAEQLDRARELFRGGVLWGIGLTLLLITHAASLLIPERVIVWNSVPARLYILEVTGLLAAVLVLIGWLRVLWRHFTKSKGSILGEAADALFLSVTLVSLVSGLVMAGAFRWASSWGAATLTPYVHSLADGSPRLDYLAALPFAAKLHVATAFAALAVLPFSSVAPFLIVLLHRLFGLLGRPLGAGSRVAEGWFRKLNPAVWIWPEED